MKCRAMQKKWLTAMLAAGMVLLLALMAFVMFNDIIRIVMK